MLRWTLSALLTLSLAAHAADEKEDGWDVAGEHGPTETVTFSVDEGTWMNLDVSPDGMEIVFDLLGDLYLLPVAGGQAQRLTNGPAMDLQPRFSPDGQWISFTSDRAGGDNLWIMKRDGSEPTQVTKEDFRLLNNAVWTPDGQYLIAKKHFTSTRSIGAGEMWLYHRSGGAGLQLTVRKNDQQDVGEPSLSADGRYLYFSEDMSPGPNFEYNKDPNGQIYVVRQLDLETGRLRNLVTGMGGSARPQISRDGRTLAYVRRIRERTALCLFDRETAAHRVLYDDLTQDQQEAWAIYGVYPNYNWTPDDKAILIWAKGKIRRIDIATGAATVVPFSAGVAQTLTKALRSKQVVHQDRFTVRMIRDLATAPDGKTIVFHALGQLWKKSLPDGTPQRLTKADHFEYQPSFSPDGRTIAYTTWSDADFGAVRTVGLNGGQSTKITTRPGYYHTPRFSPDGSKIVFRKSEGNHLLGYRHGVETGLYWVAASGGEPNLICEDGREPRFDATGARVYYLTGGGLEKHYRSVTLNGADERTHFDLKYATHVVPSPDGRWVAFQELFKVYIAALPRTGSAVDLSKDSKAVPLVKVSADAGNYLHWSADSKRLHWVIGPEYHTRALTDSFTFLDGAADPLPEPAAGIPIGLEAAADVPEGSVAFTGGRIIPMQGDRVIENGTLLVAGNRIVALGDAGSIAIPPDAYVVDARGRTIIPGIVDAHAHNNHFINGPLPQNNWSYLVNLAYGVTTGHDPSANSETVFSLAELVKAGKVTGPRIFSTGTILYGADGDYKAVVDSLDDARSHLRRMAAVGAFSVKSYNQPRREQRQQILKAARELGMLVVNEGGSTFFQNLAMIIDGTTGIEHNLPVAPLYRDVLELWQAAEVRYTPTLVVSFGGISGEFYWYQHTNVWEQQPLLTFTPRWIVDARSRRRQMLPEDDFHHIDVSRSAKALADRGVKLCLGAHGQLQGLGAHWELWMFAQGGMTPLEALHAATINGAEYLGLDDEIGSLEKGKLADLVVLTGNPLEDIHQSEKVEMVMVNGRLYETATMNQIGNHPATRPPLYWESDGTGASGIGPSLGLPGSCGCRTHSRE